MKTPAGVTVSLFIYSSRCSTTLRVFIWFWQNCSRRVCTIPFAKASRPSEQRARGGFCSVGNFRSLNAISFTRKNLIGRGTFGEIFFLRNSELRGSYRHLIRGRGGAIDRSVWWHLLSISVKKKRGSSSSGLSFRRLRCGVFVFEVYSFLKLKIN